MDLQLWRRTPLPQRQHRRTPERSGRQSHRLLGRTHYHTAMAATADRSPGYARRRNLERHPTPFPLLVRPAECPSHWDGDCDCATPLAVRSGRFETAGNVSWFGNEFCRPLAAKLEGHRSVPDMHGDRLPAGITMTTSPSPDFSE